MSTIGIVGSGDMAAAIAGLAAKAGHTVEVMSCNKALEHAAPLTLGLVAHSVRHTNVSIGVSLHG